MKRADCLRAIYADLADCAVVTIMGAVAAELYALGHRPNHFYQEHAMGTASSVGLGIALARPDRKVVVLDGDGSVLMNLGTFSTMARYRPRNLTHVVFDNESLLSVGGFPTATATGSDLAGIARASGVGAVQDVRDVDAFAVALRAAIDDGQLSCVVAKVDPSGPASYQLGIHLLENRFEFARWLSREPR